MNNSGQWLGSGPVSPASSEQAHTAGLPWDRVLAPVCRVLSIPGAGPTRRPWSRVPFSQGDECLHRKALEELQSASGDKQARGGQRTPSRASASTREDKGGRGAVTGKRVAGVGIPWACSPSLRPAHGTASSFLPRLRETVSSLRTKLTFTAALAVDSPLLYVLTGRRCQEHFKHSRCPFLAGAKFTRRQSRNPTRRESHQIVWTLSPNAAVGVLPLYP